MCNPIGQISVEEIYRQQNLELAQVDFRRMDSVYCKNRELTKIDSERANRKNGFLTKKKKNILKRLLFVVLKIVLFTKLK